MQATGEPCVGDPDRATMPRTLRYAALRHIGIVACCNLRFRKISNVYAKGTLGRAGGCLASLPMVLVAPLLLATGLFVGPAHGAIDAAKVSVELVARPGSASGAGQDFRVPDGSVLRTGDGVQLRLESDTDVYVYVIAYGSSNTAVLLHPFSARPGDALIRKGQTAVIPEGGVFLPLDGREGRETLFTIISDVPLAEIVDLLPRIEAHEGNTRGIAAMLGAAYPLVRHLSFKHIGASPLVGIALNAPRASPPAESPGLTSDTRNTGGNVDRVAERVAGASPPAPAGGDWSASASRDFGVGIAAAAQSPPGTIGDVPGGATASEKDSAPVSSALRDARKAAGIDRHQFRGILATLPGGSQAEVPESMLKPHEEQGVLGGGGSRIRALGRAQVRSSESWPGDDGDSQNKLQN